MNANILGQYDLSRVSIDCNSSYSNFIVYAHELAHFSLTKNTLFGILHFLARQINESTPSARLGSIVGVMTDASERTQEVYGMYYELIHISSQYKRYFKSYYYNFKHEAYYTKYQFQDFEWIIGKNGLNNDSKLIDRMATIAMNVDITKYADSNPWESSRGLFRIISENKTCYMPDYRLKKLLTLTHALGIPELHKMSDDEIARAADIQYLKFTTETVMELLTRLANQFDEIGYSSSLIHANINNIKTNQIKLGYYLPRGDDFSTTLKQTILPECLNHRFEEIPLVALPRKGNHDIEVVTLYDYSPTCLCEFTDFKAKRKYSIISKTNAVNEYLKDYRCITQFYFDDYQTVLQNWPSLAEKRLFFILKNPYYEFKTLIADYMSAKKYAFIYKLNDGVIFLFVPDSENNLFYTCQSMINIDSIITDFNNGFYSTPDSLFWTENNQWRDYARILSNYSETDAINLTQEEFASMQLYVSSV